MAKISTFQQHLINAYLTAADWADDTNVDYERAVTDCLAFLHRVESAGIDTYEMNPEQIGHDFWLTRNGHGSGFWDRPEVYGDDNAEKLSDIARAFGEYYE